MVLATRLISLGGMMFALLSAGCQAESRNISDEITLDKHNLQLVSENQNACL